MPIGEPQVEATAGVRSAGRCAPSIAAPQVPLESDQYLVVCASLKTSAHEARKGDALKPPQAKVVRPFSTDLDDTPRFRLVGDNLDAAVYAEAERMFVRQLQLPWVLEHSEELRDSCDGRLVASYDIKRNEIHSGVDSIQTRALAQLEQRERARVGEVPGLNGPVGDAACARLVVLAAKRRRGGALRIRPPRRRVPGAAAGLPHPHAQGRRRLAHRRREWRWADGHDGVARL